MPLLEVRDLTVAFDTTYGSFRAVDGISLTVDIGEVLAIVGEWGRGLALLRKAIKLSPHYPGWR